MFAKTNYEFYFVYGRDQENKVEPYIEVDCEEVYENLSLKTYFIIEHFLQTDHDKLIKMDDDTFINFDKFNLSDIKEDYVGVFLQHSTKQISTIEHWHCIKTPEFKVPKKLYDVFYAEGGFYMLSRKAAALCYDEGYDFYVNTPETYVSEDIKVGLCLQKHKEVSILDLRWECDLNYETAKDFLVIHPVNILLFDKLANSTSIEETRSILLKYDVLNKNVERIFYLTKILKTL